MKKQITRPDGTVETVEGTAEELAEYERKLQEGSVEDKKFNKKKLLNEEIRAIVAEEIIKIIPLLQQPVYPQIPVILPYPQTFPEKLYPWYVTSDTTTIENKDIIIQ